MDNETYNGWSNRETWAANLWMTNDPSSYEFFANLPKDADLREEFEIYYGLDDRNNPVYDVLLDVGSLWRVNWHEIASNFLTE